MCRSQQFSEMNEEFSEISEIECNLVADFEDCDETELMSIQDNRQ